MFKIKMIGETAVFVETPLKEYKPLCGGNAGYITESYGSVSSFKQVDLLVLSYEQQTITIEPHFKDANFVVIKMILLDPESVANGMLHISSIKFSGESLDNFYRQFVGVMNAQAMLKAKELGDFDAAAQLTLLQDFLKTTGVHVNFHERKNAQGIKYFAANFKPFAHKYQDAVSYALTQI